jgi:hypothetical protein
MRKALIATAIVGALAATPAHAQFWGSSPMWGMGYGGYGYGMGPGAAMGMMAGMGLLGGIMGGVMAAQAAPPPPPMPVAAAPAPVALPPGAGIVEETIVQRPLQCHNSRGWDERYGWVRKQYCR